MSRLKAYKLGSPGSVEPRVGHVIQGELVSAEGIAPNASIEYATKGI